MRAASLMPLTLLMSLHTYAIYFDTLMMPLTLLLSLFRFRFLSIDDALIDAFA